MESAFQFSNPSLTKMEFCINEDFENSWDKEVKIAVNMGIQIDRSSTDNNARVSLTLEIGKKDSSDPFYVCATEMAEFRWPDSLNVNGRKIAESKCPFFAARVFKTYYFADYGSITI